MWRHGTSESTWNKFTVWYRVKSENMSGRHIWLIVPYLLLCISLYSSFYYFLCVFSVCSLVTFSSQKVCLLSFFWSLISRSLENVWFKLEASQLDFVEEAFNHGNWWSTRCLWSNRHQIPGIDHSWLTRWLTTSQKPTRPWEWFWLENFPRGMCPFPQLSSAIWHQRADLFISKHFLSL